MNAPDYRRDGDEFSYTWPDLGIGIGLESIRESSDGLSAEITIRSSGSRIREGHLHWAKLNLASTTARNSLARTLKERYEGIADFAGMLEYACTKTAQEYRKGEPVVRLRDVVLSRELPTDLISHFIPLGETSVIFADGGSLKSLLAMSAAVAVAADMPLCAGAGLFPRRKANVMYLDWETNAEEQAERMRLICEGLDIEVPDNISYRAMYRPLADEVSRVRVEVSQQDVGFIVLDSIAPACGGEPESAEVITRFFNALRSLGAPGRPVTRLVVSHVSKAGADQRNGAARPFGSVFVQNLARSVWEIRRGEDDGENTVNIGMFHRKANRGRLQRPLGLRAEFGETFLRWKAAAVADDSELAPHASLPYRIREALRRGSVELTVLADELDAKEDTIYRALRKMPDTIRLDDGRGGRSKASVWGLKADAS